MGWAISGAFVSCGISGLARQGRRIPELEVDDALDADLWDIIVVEEGVCYAGDAEEEDTGGCKEESAYIGSLGRL